ncbi:MAG TPA: chemotaxis protein CheW [Syntrophomonadaceae bacterium]|nr:chemotaxis protein CheW [Syntrophomonadaceae bacterium]HOQ08679.1 chemotaxis protein CheW [Syntrophomonadaceae bacterium]HPU48730.1 chemotaxis protein CheW [Syntrophomonadaceae bacterium]
MQDIRNLPAEDSYHEDQELQVVAFRLGNEEYAVDILYVQEIIRLLNITRVPRSGPHIEGVINLRGNIIPIVNLHSKFNLQAAEDEEDKRIIVFKWDEMQVGVIVDEVSEVIRIKRQDIEAASKVYGALEADHIKGIAKIENRLLILLNLAKIFEAGW